MKNLSNFKLDLIRQKWAEFIKSRYYVYSFILIGLLALIFDLSYKPKSENKVVKAPESVDTLIPHGYILVPIDIQNHNSVDSILGNFGVVDLYASSSDGKSPSRKMAQRVKILRAPLNPNQFAVLVKEENAPQIAGHSGSFFVMIQNPNENNTHFIKNKNRIVLEN